MFIIRLIKNTIFPIFCLFIFVYITPIDYKLFRVFNDSLGMSKGFAYFWALMNHNTEKWLNVLVMLGINLYALKYVTNKQSYIKEVGLAILWFQLALVLVYLIVNKYFVIYRLSPSIVYRQDFFSLQQMFQNPDIKVYSNNSFPSGHALVALYWAQICRGLLPKHLYVVVLVIAILLSISRLFSGAHWVSDVIFAFLIANIWSNIFFHVKAKVLLSRFKEQFR